MLINVRHFTYKSVTMRTMTRLLTMMFVKCNVFVLYPFYTHSGNVNTFGIPGTISQDSQSHAVWTHAKMDLVFASSSLTAHTKHSTFRLKDNRGRGKFDPTLENGAFWEFVSKYFP